MISSHVVEASNYGNNSRSKSRGFWKISSYVSTSTHKYKYFTTSQLNNNKISQKTLLLDHLLNCRELNPLLYDLISLSNNFRFHLADANEISICALVLAYRDD